MIPKQDYFALKDLYQEVLFYFLGIADFKCMNERISNKEIYKKQISFMKRCC